MFYYSKKKNVSYKKYAENFESKLEQLFLLKYLTSSCPIVSPEEKKISPLFKFVARKFRNVN